MAAGLQIKNTLTSKDPVVREQLQQRWLSFPEDVRLYIKTNVSARLFLFYCKLSYMILVN